MQNFHSVHGQPKCMCSIFGSLHHGSHYTQDVAPTGTSHAEVVTLQCSITGSDWIKERHKDAKRAQYLNI